MLNILVTGSTGQLGSEIKDILQQEEIDSSDIFFFTNKENLDISNYEAVKQFIQKNAIDCIINCAAYTAVDKAEEDEAHANHINHIAVSYLAKIAKKFHLQFIHISTDYVFDGMNYRPYLESDLTHPNGIYGQTKLAGEEAIKSINPSRTIIIRTSWVYSSFGNNFVKTMLKLGKQKDTLGVIFDQVGTPTYARDLAKTILTILPQINNQNVEIYNYSNEGVLSWFDFAKVIMKSANIECKVEPIETTDYPTPAKRPYYSLLNKTKIKTIFKMEIPYWKDSLDECLRRMGEKQ